MLTVSPWIQPATLVAVAVRDRDIESGTNGGLYLFRATDGEFITNVDQTGGNSYYDAAWDNVGNLYTVDDTAQVWRAYSPPGTNQATTVAVPVIQAYNALQPPFLSNPVGFRAGCASRSRPKQPHLRHPALA